MSKRHERAIFESWLCDKKYFVQAEDGPASGAGAPRVHHPTLDIAEEVATPDRHRALTPQSHNKEETKP